LWEKKAKINGSFNENGQEAVVDFAVFILGLAPSTT